MAAQEPWRKCANAGFAMRIETNSWAMTAHGEAITFHDAVANGAAVIYAVEAILGSRTARASECGRASMNGGHSATCRPSRLICTRAK
jgi:hypothetical protein